MKKEISSFVLVLSLMSLSNAVKANWFSDTGNSSDSSLFSLWKDEDEEDKIQKKSSTNDSTIKSQKSNSQKNTMGETKKSQTYNNTNANYGYFVNTKQQQYKVASTKDSSNVSDSDKLIQQSPLYFVPSNNNNDNSYNIDYDTLQSERTSDYNEIANSIDKWKNGGTNVFWENYRGNNIRIEMLRNNRDLKEMRLKFVQSQSMTSDPDGSISDILNVVADRVMKRTCGKKSKQSVILYERPSVELERETAADGYKVMAKGTSLKEYGFRCIY